MLFLAILKLALNLVDTFLEKVELVFYEGKDGRICWKVFGKVHCIETVQERRS